MAIDQNQLYEDIKRTIAGAIRAAFGDTKEERVQITDQNVMSVADMIFLRLRSQYYVAPTLDREKDGAAFATVVRNSVCRKLDMRGKKGLDVTRAISDFANDIFDGLNNEGLLVPQSAYFPVNGPSA